MLKSKSNLQKQRSMAQDDMKMTLYGQNRDALRKTMLEYEFVCVRNEVRHLDSVKFVVLIPN